MAYCPARPPELIRSHPSFISAPPRAFVFQLSFLQFHPASLLLSFVPQTLVCPLKLSTQVFPPDPNEWKYGILLAAEEVVRAGVLSYAPGSESEHVSLVSPFIDWSCFVGWCLFVGGAFVCFVWFFLAR